MICHGIPRDGSRGAAALALQGRGPATGTRAVRIPPLNTAANAPVFAEASGMKKKEEEGDKKPLEPLPEIPGMPMTVDQAYDCTRARVVLLAAIAAARTRRTRRACADAAPLCA